MTSALDPVRIGSWDLPHALVMGPMTRSRAGVGNVPTAMSAEYYAQRASAGLIITEGTAPSAVGQGFPFVPGLYTDDQVEGWRSVVEAVHARGGVIVAQLMHAGRIAQASNKDGAETVAPSALRAAGEMFTATGPQEHDQPRALATDELGEVVAEFVTAARNAIAAGFDGVEIHGANGFLLHQFLSPATNVRQDGYGGSPQARARLVVELVTAVAAAIGPRKVGLRLSPANGFGGTAEVPGPDLDATYRALVDGISAQDIAYLSLAVSSAGPVADLARDLRHRFGGSVLVNTASMTDPTSLDSAEQALRDGLGDAVVVCRAWLANPDLVERWKNDAALNTPDPSSFYGGTEVGYTDYPTLTAAAAR